MLSKTNPEVPGSVLCDWAWVAQFKGGGHWPIQKKAALLRIVFALTSGDSTTALGQNWPLSLPGKAVCFVPFLPVFSLALSSTVKY